MWEKSSSIEFISTSISCLKMACRCFCKVFRQHSIFDFKSNEFFQESFDSQMFVIFRNRQVQGRSLETTLNYWIKTFSHRFETKKKQVFQMLLRKQVLSNEWTFRITRLLLIKEKINSRENGYENNFLRW